MDSVPNNGHEVVGVKRTCGLCRVELKWKKNRFKIKLGRAHGKVSKFKGHKPNCPFKNCTCQSAEVGIFCILGYLNARLNIND